MRRHDWYSNQAVNLGTDAPADTTTPATGISAFLSNNLTAVIVVGGVLVVAASAAIAIHHAKAKKTVKKNPYMPGHISDYIKTQVKMIPHHIAYAKGAMGK